MEKVRKKEKRSESIANINVVLEIAWASSIVDFTWGYKCKISNADLDATKKLGQARVKKY